MDLITETVAGKGQQVDFIGRDERGMTLLMHAVRNQSALMTKKLLDCGAELEGTGVAVQDLPMGSKRCKLFERWYYCRGGKWAWPCSCAHCCCHI